MKSHFAAAGAFVIGAVVLFGGVLFLIGDRHKAFSHHVDFFTEIADINGIGPGAKVRVSGFEAGELSGIEIPGRPSGRFRLKLHVDDKLKNLIRTDSLVTVESDGLVGDKFILIHNGTDQAAEAANGATLPSKEPTELSDVIAKVTGLTDQATVTIGDLRGKADVAMDAITATVNNTNGAVTQIRKGSGTVGMLLNDQQTADDIKGTVTKAREAAANLDQATVQVNQVITDFQSRNLFGKAGDTLDSAKHAAGQLDQSSQQVNGMLTEALAPGPGGENAAQNLQESLTNINLTSANMADDTEALKHEFFFRGFFKKRGFYSLQDLTPEQYRTDPYFQSHNRQRVWLDATAFSSGTNGEDFLSPAGKQQIDQMVGGFRNAVVDQPMVIEGYASQASPADQVALSRARSIVVAHYMEHRFRLNAKDVAVMPLNDAAPSYSGKSSWDGACIVLLGK